MRTTLIIGFIFMAVAACSAMFGLAGVYNPGSNLDRGMMGATIILWVFGLIFACWPDSKNQ